MDAIEAQAAVAAGVAWLEANYPDWREWICAEVDMTDHMNNVYFCLEMVDDDMPGHAALIALTEAELLAYGFVGGDPHPRYGMRGEADIELQAAWDAVLSA